MKRFVLMHVGFEQPTPEIMQRWKTWFASVADRTVEHIGCCARDYAMAPKTYRSA